MKWRPCIVAVRALSYDEYGMPFYYLELEQNNSKPRGCHASYIAPRKSALPLRMVEVENPDELLHETFSVFQPLGPPISRAGPAPLAILTLPPLRSDNSNDGGLSLLKRGRPQTDNELSDASSDAESHETESDVM